MSRDLREVQEDAIDRFSGEPMAARKAEAARATLREGLRCEIETDGHRLVVDMPPTLGGQDDGPSPDDLIRAALASSLAAAVRMRAAMWNLVVDRVEVTVEGQIDRRGLLGAGEVPPGHLTLEANVYVEGDIPDGQMEALVEWAEQHCPVLDDLRRGLPVEVTRG